MCKLILIFHFIKLKLGYNTIFIQSFVFFQIIPGVDSFVQLFYQPWLAVVTIVSPCFLVLAQNNPAYEFGLEQGRI